jgi:2-keto-4-pentenoate hydratase/2-oxohepta-3-ene-1,7-dioic acid hydratase in catechol pathway
MRLVTYRIASEPHIGVLSDELIVDVGRALARAGQSALPASMRELLTLGNSALAEIGSAVGEALKSVSSATPEYGLFVPVREAILDTPVSDPSKIICVGRNYADHVKEVGASRPDRAVFFTRFPQTLVCPGGPVWLPKASDELDWEGELAVVIGKQGRHVAAKDAYSIIAGYSILNDVSVRDFQLRTPQYTSGKNFDATAPFGPSIVTVDEIPDPHALTIETLVNGERMQYARTSEMLFSIPELIADITEWTTLRPGDVIATGTPEGVGGQRKPPRFLVVGDTVTVRISGIGELSNPVIAEPDSPSMNGI